MKNIAFIVLCLVCFGGCSSAARLTSQLAESVGLRFPLGASDECVPVIYPAESSSGCGNSGGGSSSADWEYGASGDLQCDDDRIACKK